LRRRAKVNYPVRARRFVVPHSLVGACTRLFGSFEAAAAAAEVDPTRIVYRRPTSRCHMKKGGPGAGH